MSEDRIPFFGGPVPRWRVHARRNLFVRQIFFVSAAAALLLTILYLSNLRHDKPLSVIPEGVETQPYVPASGVHLDDTPLPFVHKADGINSNLHAPHVEDEISTPTPYIAHPPEQPEVSTTVEPPQPLTFALIMWSEHSASEGAILLKSIMMYTSAPVHIHIICDDEAQRYLERRLALVRRPRHDITVRFYRPTLEAMLARIEREGKITTVHVAGIPGLMKLFIHEILPPSIEKAIFVDTDAFFISDPLLLWHQFDSFNNTTAISLPSHPEMFAPQWFDANRICSCIMLLDLAKLRDMRLMHSPLYPNTVDALGPKAFQALFGDPNPETGRYEDVALGDQSFWWAIIKYREEMFQHLHFDWEVSSCLLDMYMTGLGHDDAAEEDELKVQLHTWATPHQGEAIMPKLVHFNCLEGPRYHEWSGWDDPANSLAQRWAPTVKYHAGYKWLWLNQGQGSAQVKLETVRDVKFADELVESM